MKHHMDAVENRLCVRENGSNPTANETEVPMSIRLPRIRLVVFLLVMVLIAVGFSLARRVFVPYAGDYVRYYRAMRIIQNQGQVEIYKLCDLKDVDVFDACYEDFTIEGGPFAVSEEQNRSIKNLLIDGTDLTHLAKACRPSFSCRLRFVPPDEASVVEVDVCFECKILAVYYNQKEAGYPNCDNIAHELRMIVDDITNQAPN